MLLRSAQIASLPDGAVEQAILDAVLDEIGNRQGEALDIVSALPSDTGSFIRSRSSTRK